ncbi:MAG TPA: proton-conducting membrane transporter [Firmicutes bacterium]|jgi:NADH:ubiquinone oxidoreductase subunit 5 (subunit L)/multisubunit Na+/H+ antiporter MnhA subunit|nr:proton-conducting membrane transporter [Bacillota bacterium]
MSILLLLILIPALYGILLLVYPSKVKSFWEVISVVISAYLIFLVLNIWGQPQNVIIPWAGFGMDFQLRFYQFSQFIVTAITVFVFLGTLYSTRFMLDHPHNNQFYGFLFLTEAMAIGAALANNLVIMLFFWEALLITLFTMINLGKEKAFKTAVKAFVISSLGDLCLMLGIGITEALAKTLVMTDIHLETTGLGAVAFVFMLIGAMAKAGAMPFHSWIPDAAEDAPLPFAAILPTVISQLLGIYLLARIVLDFFTLSLEMRLLVMSIGAITILFGVMMALIQNDFKRLLSYSAISQVGYMLLGIGTGIPIAVAGGLLHMLNHAMFKSCLFFTGGSLEKQTGSTDLNKLGGLWKKLPVTFGCFAVAAAAASGIPPFNGFVSNQMIFEGTLQSGYRIFFVVAILGALFTTAVFLKLGHATFFGTNQPESEQSREAHWTMLTPPIILALGCIFFGVCYAFPLDYLIKPSLSDSLREGLALIHFAFRFDQLLWFTLFTLAIAFINHIIGVKLDGRGLGAVEHIRKAPLLNTVYDLAERRTFDPYVQGKVVGRYAALGLFGVDRGINWIYQEFVPTVATFVGKARRFHNGLYANYLSWSLGGFVLLVAYYIWFF